MVRPFYWAVIPKSCDSIFNELDDIHTQIDYSKFEEWFCISSDTQQLRIEKQNSSAIKDTRRLFIVSISLKTFEKKEINLSNERLLKLSLEDLVVVDTLIPTNEEYRALVQNKEGLNTIETKMLEFYPYRNLMKILIFERKFLKKRISG